MLETGHVHPADLSRRLLDVWQAQVDSGFLLTDPANAHKPVSESLDRRTGVLFRFRWLPHREIRGDVAELERRGILDPNRDLSRLYGDPRDPGRRHCFLCRGNIVECHPKEILVPMTLAGRGYFAGANFAWIEPAHFTVMSEEHTDQVYSRHVLEAMVELHVRTGGKFRILFNGPDAGATICWHLHFQITTAEMPVERLQPDRAEHYPTPVCCYHGTDDGLEQAHHAAESWLSADPENHSLNMLIASPRDDVSLFLFPRDKRFAAAEGKGLVGGFEVAGDFALSAPAERETFDHASVQTAVRILTEIRPPHWDASAAA